MLKVRLCILVVFLANSFALFSQEDSPNLIIITLDGFRWNEVFMGSDPDILSRSKSTKGEGFHDIFWHDDHTIRRKLLMPFLWTGIASWGSIYGNRNYRCRVNVANRFLFSYPGYHEILTGNPHSFINSNSLGPNPDITVLEKINQLPGFRNKVAVFSSWSVFPDIINEERSGIFVNSGFSFISDSLVTEGQLEIEEMYKMVPKVIGTVRYDGFTFVQAFEYLKEHRPRVMMIAFGETDEFGHMGDYAQYLHAANRVDRYLAELWSWLQSDSTYTNNTTLIITTDHGRGAGNNWKNHGALIARSNESWIAIIGPGIEPRGEVRTPGLYHNAQIAATISHVLGADYEGNNPRYVQLIETSMPPSDIVLEEAKGQ